MSTREPTEQQRERREELGARFPAAHFDLIEAREDGTLVYEWTIAGDGGKFQIALDGTLSYADALIQRKENSA